MKMSDKPRQMRILMVDDNPGDAQLIIEAARDLGLPLQFQTANDGEKALSILRAGAEDKSAGLPNLVMLDLNLPRKDGWTVLAEIKGDPKLKYVPVIILTGSKSEKDIQTAYDLRANGYLNKPAELAELGQLMKCVGEFWGKNVTVYPANHP
jgi:CheY-like chemotaxis protein